MDDLPLSLRQLRIVFGVSMTRHAGNAASMLHMSQPALSRGLAQAEAQLGVKLFQRGWSGAEPTALGQIVVAQCDRILSALERFERDLPGRANGPLRLPARLHWRHLQAISAAVHNGSAKSAARDMAISQPAVSKLISEATAILGDPLFRRLPHGLAPTGLAHDVTALWNRLREDLTALPSLLAQAATSGLYGRVAVGMLPFSDQDLVLRSFGSLSNDHPNLRLVAVSASYPMLIDSLLRHEIDLVMGILRNPAPSDRVQETRLYSEHFTLVTARDHPCHDRPPTMADLAKLQWMVAPHGTPTRQYFDRLFMTVDTPPPAQTFEIMSFTNAELMVANSRSVGLMNYSEYALGRLSGELRQIDFELPDAEVPVGVTMRKNGTVPPPVAAFLEKLRGEVSARGLG